MKICLKAGGQHTSSCIFAIIYLLRDLKDRNTVLSTVYSSKCQQMNTTTTIHLGQQKISSGCHTQEMLQTPKTIQFESDDSRPKAKNSFYFNIVSPSYVSQMLLQVNVSIIRRPMKNSDGCSIQLICHLKFNHGIFWLEGHLQRVSSHSSSWLGHRLQAWNTQSRHIVVKREPICLHNKNVATVSKAHMP